MDSDVRPLCGDVVLEERLLMFVLQRFLQAIAEIIGVVLEIYTFIVVLHALLSWVNPDPRNPIVRFVASVTEPALTPFRRLLPPYKTGGIDLSPVFLIFVILFLRKFIVPVLFDVAARLQ
jgi:YggT family protein